MSFDVDTHAELRATMLADWRARYQARGYDLDVSQDSDAYCWADAVAFLLEGLEARALQLTKELFPNTASSAFLEQHASVIGFVRKPATKARVVVTALGAGSWTTADRLVAPSGQQYAPVAGGTAGVDVLLVEALLAGADGNLAPGSPIAWNPAPPGLTANTTVASVGVIGVDIELDADFARRILAYWRERPGGGNRADWADWAESVSGVEAAFVYPLLHPSLGAGTPGTVTVCVTQPMPTFANVAGEPLSSNSRVASGAVLTAISTYLFTTNGGVCPAVIDPANVTVATVAEQAQAVDVQVTPGAGYAFPWSTGPLAFTSGTTTTVEVASLPSGLVNNVLVAIPDNAVRGLYAYRKVTVTGAGPYTLTFDAVGAPSATGSVLPLPGNAFAIRTAVLAVFDALGPGDSIAPSLRWPDANGTAYPQTLYRSSLIAGLQGFTSLGIAGVPGVVNVAITLVGSGTPEYVIPPVKTLVKCGALRILF